MKSKSRHSTTYGRKRIISVSVDIADTHRAFIHIFRRDENRNESVTFYHFENNQSRAIERGYKLLKLLAELYYD